ncbi:MAG: hypothetical protein ABIH34_08320 [Nanoarchaeota archaeon]
MLELITNPKIFFMERNITRSLELDDALNKGYELLEHYIALAETTNKAAVLMREDASIVFELGSGGTVLRKGVGFPDSREDVMFPAVDLLQEPGYKEAFELLRKRQRNHPEVKGLYLTLANYVLPILRDEWLKNTI